MTRRPPRSTRTDIFPYTTLFRSVDRQHVESGGMKIGPDLPPAALALDPGRGVRPVVVGNGDAGCGVDHIGHVHRIVDRRDAVAATAAMDDQCPLPSAPAVIDAGAPNVPAADSDRAGRLAVPPFISLWWGGKFANERVAVSRRDRDRKRAV